MMMQYYFHEIPIPTCRDQKKKIRWVLTSPIFDSIWPLKVYETLFIKYLYKFQFTYFNFFIIYSDKISNFTEIKIHETIYCNLTNYK